MSGATLTGFTPIAEGSDATPGLFNSRLQALSDNIASVNSVVISPVNLSLSTWASIGLNANSSNSDYIRFVDTSGGKSTYRIGSNAGGTADGLNIFDESGNTMIASFSKQSIRFFQQVVGPVFDVGGALSSTLNAATFGTGADSKESRIQAAINAASAQAISRVYIPQSMLPYSASSVSFVYPVQMIREGGDASQWDAFAYGAKADGLQDDAPALAVLFQVGSSQSVGVVLPGGTYRCGSWLSCIDVPTVTGVPDITVLKPDSGVSSPFFTHNVVNQSRSLVQGIRINGSNTLNKIGAFLGTGPIQTLLSWKDFYISGFTGSSGGTGMRIGNVVQCNLDGGFLPGNGAALDINGVTIGYPTVIDVKRTSMRDSARQGCVITEGYLINFDKDCVFESNGSAGCRVAPTAGKSVLAVLFDGCWWESNQQGFAISSSSRTLSFALEVDGTLSTAQVALRGGYFNINATSEKCAHFTASRDYVVENVRLGGVAIPAAFVLDGAGGGTFRDWPVGANGAYGTVVSDTNQQVSSAMLGAIGGNMYFTDATYDIGASGASRPKNLFMTGQLIAGTSPNQINIQNTTASGANQPGALLTGQPNTTINPDNAGITGRKFVVAYYNQSGFQSAISVANVASGKGTLQLMSDGGTVDMGSATTISTATLFVSSGISIGNATAAGSLIRGISSTSSLVAAFVVQPSASSFTRISWTGVQPGDQILTTIMPDAAQSSMSSGLVPWSHCTIAGFIEMRLSNVSTLAQNQSSKTYFFTRITPF